MAYTNHWLPATCLALGYAGTTAGLALFLGTVSDGLFPDDTGAIVNVNAFLFAGSILWAWTMLWSTALLAIRRKAMRAGHRLLVDGIGTVPLAVAIMAAVALVYSASQTGVAGVLTPLLAIVILPVAVVLNPMAALVLYGSTIIFIIHLVRKPRRLGT